MRARGASQLAPAVCAQWCRTATSLVLPRFSLGTRPLLDERKYELVYDSTQGISPSEAGLKPVASRNIVAGEVVFQEDGKLRTSPGLYTIQIDFDQHLEMLGDVRYTAHSFSPTCYCRIMELSDKPIDIVALRDIRRGEEISFDYETTEWELLDGGFIDGNSGRACQGFKHKSEEDKSALLVSGILPKHILRLWIQEMLERGVPAEPS
eukprot:scaffold41372_cov40-Tisochrysis_lutea.AAC.1